MLIKSIAWFGVMLASRCLKLSLLIGSTSSISLLHITAPLSASLFSGINGLFTIAGLILAHLIFPLFPLKLGLPMLVATLSWSVAINKIPKKWLLPANIFCHFVLPITCMMLFITHPIGNEAWGYSLYWLIPVGIASARFLNFAQHTFFSGLQSTFVAHAVGSIIWLYTVPMTSGQWLALIPLVAIERFTLAGLMTVGHEAITAFTKCIASIQSKPNTNSVNI